MVNIVVLPLGNYPTGTQNWGPTAVADNVSTLQFAIARQTSADMTIWPNASTVLSFSLTLVNQDGSTLSLGGLGGAPGGIVLDDDGVTQIPFTYVTISLPAGTGRKIQGSVTIVGGPLHTSGSLTVT